MRFRAPVTTLIIEGRNQFGSERITMPRKPNIDSGDAPVQRSFRLPAATLARLDARARERGRSTNALAARLIEEGLRTEEHPLIYFRDGAAGPAPGHARDAAGCLAGGRDAAGARRL